jgi:hypothetical protein
MELQLEQASYARQPVGLCAASATITVGTAWLNPAVQDTSKKT